MERCESQRIVVTCEADCLSNISSNPSAAEPVIQPIPPAFVQSAGDGTFLRICSVGKRYGSHIVLQSVSLDVHRGEFLTILGESGSGKTTLLRILAGFEEASSGEVLLEGAPLLSLPAARRPIHTVFQNYALFPHLSVFENVAYGQRVRKVPQAEITQRVNAVLHLVRMHQFSGYAPKHISGGQKQRVSLARALVNQPRLVLLDEPLSALDANLRTEMQKELKLLQRQLGITFIFVTHDQQEAMSISDRLVLLHRGRIEQCGTPREVYSRPRTAYAASFIGKSNLIEATVSAGIAHCGSFRFATSLSDGPITYSLRPECIRPAGTHAAAAGTIEFRATVDMQQFQGATVLSSLRCTDGSELIARSDASSAPTGQQLQTFVCDLNDFVPLEEPRS